jgi:hypothetical protein
MIAAREAQRSRHAERIAGIAVLDGGLVPEARRSSWYSCVSGIWGRYRNAHYGLCKVAVGKPMPQAGGIAMSVRRLPNQRQSARRTVFIKALLLREGKSGLPCTLVDISDVGARLIVDDVTEVPERFRIVMTEQGVPRRDCRLVWRGRNDVGVTFEIGNHRRDGNCELAPGSTLDDALDVFALRS